MLNFLSYQLRLGIKLHDNGRQKEGNNLIGLARQEINKITKWDNDRICLNNEQILFRIENYDIGEIK